MASSRFSQNIPDWRDVSRAAMQFAQDWGGQVSIVLRPYGSQDKPQMTIVAQLFLPAGVSGGVAPWASASVAIAGGSVGAMSAAALSALYELDREVYRRSEGMGPKTA